MKILLMGNPNVGKSALFSRITGVKVTVSNYPGTTVEFTKGHLKLGNDRAEVIDVPGTYTLEPTTKAEEVAVAMLKEGDLIINVVDATNLERNLYLTLQLLEKRKPTVIALNMWDDAQHRGISIDVKKLEELLGVPVVPTVGVTGQGVKELIQRLQEVTIKEMPSVTYQDRWGHIGNIVSQVQSLTHRHHTWLERISDATVHPIGGLFITVIIILGTFWVVRFVGESLIFYVTTPFFERFWAPLLMRLSQVLGSGGLLHNVLIGRLIEGQIDFLMSLGLLTTGFYIEFGVVVPYVFAFYLALGILEDIGYLARLAVLIDTLLHRLGVHGYAIIPTVLGLGCNVPGIMATRILESRRERFIVAILISIGIPCASSQAMILGLVGKEGGIYVAIVYGTLFLVWIFLGIVLNLIVKGFSPELMMEIPPYRLPSGRVILEKLSMRVYWFIKEALPIVLLGVLLANIFYTFHLFDYLAVLTTPIVTGLLGLPKETVVALLLGLLRKDVAIGMLVPLELTAKQLIISSSVLAMFFPCLASYVIFLREFGVKDTLKATGIMLFVALIVGSLQNLIL